MASDLHERILLIIGNFSLLSAALLCYLHPATGYELSIYTGTPIAVWVVCGIGLVIGIGGAILFDYRWTRIVALVLAVCCGVFIIALPLARGYYYLGQADALVHLGWAKDLLAGRRTADINFYPAIHYYAAIVSQLLGISVRESLMVAPIVSALIFILIVSIIVDGLSASKHGAVIGASLALCLFPIVSIRVPTLSPLPTTISLLLTPAILWTGLRSTQMKKSSYNVAFSTLAIAGVLYHSQHIATLLAMLLAIGMTTWILRSSWMPFQTDITSKSYIAVIWGVLPVSIVFVMWVISRRSFGGHLGIVIVGLIGGINAGETVTPSSSATAGLSALGGSVPEIFLKVFGVVSIACLIAGSVFLLDLKDIVKSHATKKQVLIVSLFVGLIPAVGFLFVFGLTAGLAQALRYVAFIFLFITVFAGIGLARVHTSLSRRVPKRGASIFLVIILLISVAASVPVMYRSPYVYQSSTQVTKTQLSGYDFMFTNGNDELPVLSVESYAFRAQSALYGATTISARSYGNTPAAAKPGFSNVKHHFANRSLTQSVNNTTYLIVTQYAREKTLGVYRGLTFSKRDYRYLESTSGINRVYSNGGARLYQIQSSTTAGSTNYSFIHEPSS